MAAKLVTMRSMMSLYRPYPLLLALCSALPLVAVAQTSVPAPAAALQAPASPPPARSSHVSDEQALAWFNLLDANHDGCISREEAQVAIRFAPKLTKDFDDADANRDGCITPGEIRALADRRRAERDARRAAEARQKASADQAASAAVPASGTGTTP